MSKTEAFHAHGGVEKHHFGWGLGMLQPTAAQGAWTAAATAAQQLLPAA
jgi:hypothetical protein